jgi:hypothetical protein
VSIEHAEGETPEPQIQPRSRRQKVSSNTVEIIPQAKATKRATKANAEKIRSQVYLDHMEPMLQEVFQATRAGVRRMDPVYVKLAADMLRLVDKQGPAIVAQFNNKNESRVEVPQQQSSSIDAMIRMLDQRDQKLSTAKDFIDV